MKMKLTTCCTDEQMLSRQVELKFEMLLEECNTEKLILIGTPLEKLPLNCDGLPFIVLKIYDYIVNHGIHEEYLFDGAYSNNIQKANIINAYKLVSGPGINYKTMMDVDAVDVATVLVMWLYYLPEPLVSPKQFSMICDLNISKTYGEIINSMDNISLQTLHRIMHIVDTYGRQHKSYKEKLVYLFTLLLTKHVDTSQNNASKFIDNLIIVLMEAEIENNMLNNKCLVIKENLKRDQHMCNKKNICNKKTLFRSLSDDGLQLNNGSAEKNATLTSNALKESNCCNLARLISKENNPYNNSVTNDLLLDKNNSKVEHCANLSDGHDNSVCEVDELSYSPQIDDMRSIERTMQTHSRSTMKRNNKKSIRSHVDRILRSGFLSNDDSLLLKNTLELMKILSKIKNVQNQINLQGRDMEDEFGCFNKNDHYYPELHFLNNRLELLINQKNHYLTKTGLSYGRSYNRIVLSLKNAQKEAFKLHENEKINKKSHNENNEKLFSDIYNIQIVLDYLENNCGGKELPWRSSKGCPGYRRKIKKQLNCVTVVSDLQTICEHEVMETIPQPLFIPTELSDLR